MAVATAIFWLVVNSGNRTVSAMEDVVGGGGDGGGFGWNVFERDPDSDPAALEPEILPPPEREPDPEPAPSRSFESHNFSSNNNFDDGDSSLNLAVAESHHDEGEGEGQGQRGEPVGVHNRNNNNNDSAPPLRPPELLATRNSGLPGLENFMAAANTQAGAATLGTRAAFHFDGSPTGLSDVDFSAVRIGSNANNRTVSYANYDIPPFFPPPGPWDIPHCRWERVCVEYDWDPALGTSQCVRWENVRVCYGGGDGGDDQTEY
ncbi:MAG: hypothetical protein HY401_08900 [Elusimicrobia bacterium]|nr:hypothetical protein [Elusimicrobiota bacterium]